MIRIRSKFIITCTVIFLLNNHFIPLWCYNLMNDLLYLSRCVISLALVFTLIICVPLYDLMIVFVLVVIIRYVRPRPLTLVSGGALKKITY